MYILSLLSNQLRTQLEQQQRSLPREGGGDATGQLGNQAGIVIDSVQAEQLLFLANELRCLLVSMANSLLSTHMP